MSISHISHAQRLTQYCPLKLRIRASTNNKATCRDAGSLYSTPITQEAKPRINPIKLWSMGALGN